jgi:hypothetical protein
MFRSMISACAVFASTLLLGSEPALVATATQACDRSGPERSGRETTRTIQFLKDKLPARIRVTLSSEWDPGVEPDEPDKFPDWEKPRPSGLTH